MNTVTGARQQNFEGGNLTVNARGTGSGSTIVVNPGQTATLSATSMDRRPIERPGDFREQQQRAGVSTQPQAAVIAAIGGGTANV